MTDRETWRESIRSNPSDWNAMLVFADWLEEEGDVLSAEQWRWIAVVDGNNASLKFSNDWPNVLTPHVLNEHELKFAAAHSIRCMPTYPQTIEEVQAYLETAR